MTEKETKFYIFGAIKTEHESDGDFGSSFEQHCFGTVELTNEEFAGVLKFLGAKQICNDIYSMSVGIYTNGFDSEEEAVEFIKVHKKDWEYTLNGFHQFDT